MYLNIITDHNGPCARCRLTRIKELAIAPTDQMSRVGRTPGGLFASRSPETIEKRHGGVPRRPGGLPHRYFSVTVFALAFQPPTATSVAAARMSPSPGDSRRAAAGSSCPAKEPAGFLRPPPSSLSEPGAEFMGCPGLSCQENKNRE